MAELPFIQNDYEISVQDYLTGEFINLGSGENLCGVKFDGVGTPELRESVYDVSGGDGTRFGIEFFGGINWNITGSIHSGINGRVAGDASTAWDTWSQLARAWSYYPERLTPRGVIPLYFKRPGRQEMVVYGRPNRLDPVTSASHAGFISYTATFRQSDPKFYAAVSKEVVVGLNATSYAGGIIVTSGGIKLPFTTTSSTPVTGAISQAGDAPSHPVIAITGEVVNPVVSYLNQLGQTIWTVRLNTTVANGDTVIIDTRQWERSIISLNDGTSYAGAYIGDKLQDITLLPGQGLIRYGATSSNGSSTVRVTYKDAWVST